MRAFRAALMAAAAAFVANAALADGTDVKPRAQMRVNYDQSTVIHLDRPAKTILVGNPTIADALLVNEKTIYVLGRMFGNTDVIAVDDTGTEILNTLVTVGTPNAMQVTLYRGAQGQRNLACSPHCERTLTQGDADMAKVHDDTDKKIEAGTKSAALDHGAR